MNECSGEWMFFPSSRALGFNGPLLFAEGQYFAGDGKFNLLVPAQASNHGCDRLRRRVSYAHTPRYGDIIPLS